MSATYDDDLYTWSLEQASLLRAHRFDQINLEHIIEEIEELMHMLKWQFQPAYQGRSWKFTIIEQRKRIKSHLQENPGLKSKLPELIEKAYSYAVTGAVRETGLAVKVFPEECPWSYEQFMNQDFWPDADSQ